MCPPPPSKKSYANPKNHARQLDSAAVGPGAAHRGARRGRPYRKATAAAVIPYRALVVGPFLGPPAADPLARRVPKLKTLTVRSYKRLLGYQLGNGQQAIGNLYYMDIDHISHKINNNVHNRQGNITAL